MSEQVPDGLIIDPKIAELAAHASKDETEEGMRLDRLGDYQSEIEEDDLEDLFEVSEETETAADYYAAAAEARKRAKIAIEAVINDPRSRTEVVADGDESGDGDTIPGAQ